jgi:hypothetical protein
MLRHFGFRLASPDSGFRREDTTAKAAEEFASPISAAYMAATVLSSRGNRLELEAIAIH